MIDAAPAWVQRQYHYFVSNNGETEQ